MKNSDKIAYGFLISIFGLSLYFDITDPDFFDTVFSAEDGIVEYLTAVMLFSVSMLCCVRFFKLWRFTSVGWKMGVLGFALLFFFATGEEISWGQRIFNIESGDFFVNNNAQGETNLHNLVVDGKKVNKIIFSQLLMVIMALYLIVIPLLYRKNAWLKKLMDRFAVPVVRWHHTLAFITATLLILVHTSGRKWETYELAFGVIFFLIFLHPLNAFIYRKS